MKHLSVFAFAGAFSVVILALPACGGTPPPGMQAQQGPFTFTASAYSVSVPQNTLSQEIRFNVTSDGTFAGTVVIHWEATGSCTPSPSDNDFVVTVG